MTHLERTPVMKGQLWQHKTKGTLRTITAVPGLVDREIEWEEELEDRHGVCSEFLLRAMFELVDRSQTDKHEEAVALANHDYYAVPTGSYAIVEAPDQTGHVNIPPRPRPDLRTSTPADVSSGPADVVNPRPAQHAPVVEERPAPRRDRAHEQDAVPVWKVDNPRSLKAFRVGQVWRHRSSDRLRVVVGLSEHDVTWKDDHKATGRCSRETMRDKCRLEHLAADDLQHIKRHEDPSPEPTRRTRTRPRQVKIGQVWRDPKRGTIKRIVSVTGDGRADDVIGWVPTERDSGTHTCKAGYLLSTHKIVSLP